VTGEGTAKTGIVLGWVGVFETALLVEWTHAGLGQHVSSKICAEWNPSGYRDVCVYRAGVTDESYDPTDAPAAFASAQVYRTARWSGRTDAQGCTPVLEYCQYNPNLQFDIATVRYRSRRGSSTTSPFRRREKSR